MEDSLGRESYTAKMRKGSQDSWVPGAAGEKGATHTLSLMGSDSSLGTE